MFSPLGGPKEDDQEDIDWGDDLKFYIDNNNDLLSKEIFPAVKLHHQHKDNPKVHLVYVKPLRRCADNYSKMFDIEDQDKIFTNELLEKVAKVIASEQQKHLENDDYKTQK